MDSSEESGTLMDVIPATRWPVIAMCNKQLHETMQLAIAALSDEQPKCS